MKIKFRGEEHRAVGFRGSGLEDRRRFSVHLPHYRRHPALEDSGLLAGNQSAGVPQQCAVVQTNGSNHAQLRDYYIGRIQKASQTHFNNGNVNLLAVKEPESHTRSDLKERQFRRVILLQKLHYTLLWNHLKAVFLHNLYPFPEVQQMGRCEQSHTVPASCKGCGQEGANGSFSVCPSHVNAPQTA